MRESDSCMRVEKCPFLRKRMSIRKSGAGNTLSNKIAKLLKKTIRDTRKNYIIRDRGMK